MTRDTRRRTLLRVLVVVALLLPPVVVGALWAWQESEYEQVATARAKDEAALDAARQATLTWASVDYRKPDEYIESVKRTATGEFLQQFDESAESLRALLEGNQPVQVPTIPEGGVGLIERDGDEARVVVALDTTVTNKSTRKPRPRSYRLQLTMVEHDGAWLTEQLELIP